MTSFPSWIIQLHATVLDAWLCVWQYNTCFFQHGLRHKYECKVCALCVTQSIMYYLSYMRHGLRAKPGVE